MNTKTLISIILLVVLPLVLAGLFYYLIRDYKYIFGGLILGLYLGLLINSFYNK